MSVQHYRTLAQDFPEKNDSVYQELTKNLWQNMASFHLSHLRLSEQGWRSLSSNAFSSFEKK